MLVSCLTRLAFLVLNAKFIIPIFVIWAMSVPWPYYGEMAARFIGGVMARAKTRAGNDTPEVGAPASMPNQAPAFEADIKSYW